MPEVKSGESRTSFVPRCIAYVKDKENLDLNVAVGRCNGIYNAYMKKEGIEVKDKGMYGRVLRKDASRQIVYSVALEPYIVDLENEWVGKDDIEEAAHEYLAKHRETKYRHGDYVNADVVESFIAPVAFQINGNDVAQGSWVVAMKVHDEDAWKDVEEGRIIGFSIGGTKQFI